MTTNLAFYLTVVLAFHVAFYRADILRKPQSAGELAMGEQVSSPWGSGPVCPPHDPHLVGGEKHENYFANQKLESESCPQPNLGRQIKVWQSNQKYPKKGCDQPQNRCNQQ